MINDQINKNNNLSFIEKFSNVATKNKENKPLIENKFYRKVQIGNTLLSTEIFKEGINLIIVNRNKFYTKAYEQTFDTHNNFQESENLATILKNLTYDKIAILTAIGSWTGKISISLINEIKQIGGPDISKLIKDIEDKEMEMKLNHVTLKENLFLEVIGRRGLCRYNGYFDSHLKIRSDDGIINEKIDHNKKLFINDVKNIDENEVLTNNSFNNDNSKSESKNSIKDFIYKVDSKFEISLNEDSSLGFESPSVISVSPNNGNLNGDTHIIIKGLNFFSNSDFPTQVFVRGVVCSDVNIISENEISCVTKSAKIVGAGLGNILIRGKDHSSPINTCFHYKYLNNIVKLQPEASVQKIIVPSPHAIIVHQNPQIQYLDPIVNSHILDSYSRFKQMDNIEESNRLEDKIKSTDMRYLRLPENRIMINEIPNPLAIERINDSNRNLRMNSFSNKLDSFRKNRFRKIIQGLDSNN